MAYDKELKDKIDAMGAGDLVNVMLSERQPHSEPEAYMQNHAYFWAYERLNALLPAPTPEEKPHG